MMETSTERLKLFLVCLFSIELVIFTIPFGHAQVGVVLKQAIYFPSGAS